MDHLDFSSQEALLGFGDYTDAPRADSYPPLIHHQPQNPNPHYDQRSHSHPAQHQHPTWPPLSLSPLDSDTMAYQAHQQQQHFQQYMAASSNQQQQQSQQSHHIPQQQQQQHNSRPSSNHGHQPIPLQTSTAMAYHGLVAQNWDYQLRNAAQETQHLQQQQQQQFAEQSAMGMNTNTYGQATFAGQLQTSPVDFMPNTTAETYNVTATMDPATFMTLAGPMESMNALSFPLDEYQNSIMFSAHMQNALNQQAAETANASAPGSSPTGTILEVQSLSDNEWSAINLVNSRHSHQSYTGTVSNPSQNLHIRTCSDSSSDEPDSANLSGSFEEVPPWPISPPHDFHGTDYLDAQYYHQHAGQPSSSNDCDHEHRHSPTASLAVSPTAAGAAQTYRNSCGSSSSTSPTSSGPTSPPLRRRKSPTGKTTKPVIKKTPHTTRKDVAVVKKVGRRSGPLRPDQRQQAHEIRKLRACLRCKFLKKTCDKGEPCGGCRPSHARLWQVPCTRLDIKDIGYFMKDWKADYERHVSLGFSVGNIKGFSQMERILWITHGYGHYLPIKAREVYVRDDKCFEVDWVESDHEQPMAFEQNTAKLSAGMEGVSTTVLSEYLDLHLDNTFESFVDEYFEGTKFLTEILKTAHRYYQKEKTPAIRKALKLVLAYNLTLHLTMVRGLSDEEQLVGRIEDPDSKFYGQTMAPVMINFQIKCALADMWRELQKDILEELSSLYSSVYSGEKLKNWPTIFMLAAILLAIWEEMQFDCHYRMPDEKAVNKFCEDMETTPVGVIVGLFQAISTKLPGLQEWDTRKHHHLLGSNPAVCDALTEVKEHVNKHEQYLKERANATFDRQDFDCLSNKFLSKLVIRAN